MSISFRHSAGFGKRIEYKLIGDMLMEGLDFVVRGNAFQQRGVPLEFCLRAMGETILQI